MISTLVTFVVAALIGGLSTYFCTRSYWLTTLKTTRQALYDQYSRDLQEKGDRTRLLAARERESLAQNGRLAEENWKLNEQLATEQHNFQQAESDYESRLLKMERDRAALLQANESVEATGRENVELALQDSVAIEARNRALQAKVTQLTLEKEQSEITLRTQAAQHEASLKAAYQEPDINIGSLIRKLFPSLKMLRDSVDEVSRNKRDIAAILHRLQALENKNFDHSKKVLSTGGEWSECRAPQMRMIRLYYRKENASPSHKCEVLISRKRDTKSQQRDLAWLRRQPSKR